MAKRPPEDLETFLRRQDAADLVAVLLDLADDNAAVAARLARMQLADRPDKLAAAFRKTLSAWRRSTRYHDYREASAFGRRLEVWLDEVARELVPRDPRAALSLYEAFIEADAKWFDQADDSGGAIGDAMRAACRHWLQAAARCEPPPGGWTERLLNLHLSDHYGGREALLRHAGLLLDESGQRALVSLFESRLCEVLAASSNDARLPTDVFSLSGALKLLARSLSDPDIEVRATLQYSPDPNPMQREAFVRAYLDAERPADALEWMQDPWAHLEGRRQDLKAEAFEQLGRFKESLPIRQRTFERTLSDFDFQRWLKHLPETSHPKAIAHARGLALRHPDLSSAATLLLQLDDAEAAEARLLASPAQLDGNDYGRLATLAKAFRIHECTRGETVIYRALLNNILDRGIARAYGHAARYWTRLGEIAGSGESLLPLSSHDQLVSDIRARHARKASFWAHVNRAPHGGGGDEEEEPG